MCANVAHGICGCDEHGGTGVKLSFAKSFGIRTKPLVDSAMIRDYLYRKGTMLSSFLPTKTC